MNRKILVLFSVILLSVIFIGCNVQKNTPPDEGEFNTAQEIGVDKERELSIANLYLEDGTEKDNYHLKMDQYLALKIGDEVLRATFGEECLINSKYSVTDMEKTGRFWVTRLPKRKELHVGGDYNVIIDKKTGAIIRIWIGE